MRAEEEWKRGERGKEGRRGGVRKVWIAREKAKGEVKEMGEKEGRSEWEER